MFEHFLLIKDNSLNQNNCLKKNLVHHFLQKKIERSKERKFDMDLDHRALIHSKLHLVLWLFSKFKRWKLSNLKNVFQIFTILQ